MSLDAFDGTGAGGAGSDSSMHAEHEWNNAKPPPETDEPDNQFTVGDAHLDGIVDRADQCNDSPSPEPRSPVALTPNISPIPPSSSSSSSPSPSSSSYSILDNLRLVGENIPEHPRISALLAPPAPASSNNAIWIGRHRIRHPIRDDSAEWSAIKAFKLQLEINLGANAYEKLRFTFPELGDIPSIKSLRREMESIAGLKPKLYDICQNVCICYTGAFAKATTCHHCGQPRFRPDGRPYRQFPYLPIIPQLQALYANPKTAKAMRHRSEHHINHVDDPLGTISDIYDSSHYQSLLDKFVVVDGRRLPHKFFENPQDVLLIKLTDGFRLFKRGNHSSWPLIFINANLAPSGRYHVNDVLCVGLIPGPHKPKDFDSFMSIVVEELELGAIGVPTYDAVSDELCSMHLYAPFGCGDMPAVAMAYTGGKQHSAKHACRACPIEGIRLPESRNPVHYVPIQRPPDYPDHVPSYDINNPPHRKHGSYLAQAHLVDNARSKAESNRLSVMYGINGMPITARIPGVRYPSSYPFDFMHLLENMLSNYTLLISGNFKGFDSGSEDYILSETAWKEIGVATAEANRTVPSAFGRKIPDISEDRTFFTAEAYIVWWTMYAPILLRDRFSQMRYYTHITNFISIVNRCLSFSSTKEERNKLRSDIVAWYEEYESIFYQYDTARLPACLITVHAWLHLVDYIEQSGPLWSYWCWVMERYCGRLSRAITSRKHPYASLNRRIRELQTLSMIRNLYGLHHRLPDYSRMHTSSATPSFSHISYPDITLRQSRRVLDLTRVDFISVRDRIASHLATQLNCEDVAEIKDLLPRAVVQWGKIEITDGDTICSSLGYNRKEENLRDATFIQYELLKDRNALDDDASIVLEPKTFYGQLERIIVCEIPPTPAFGLDRGATKILLDVHRCQIIDNEANTYTVPEYRVMGRHEIVDATTVRSLVGRIKDRGKWAIVQRFGGLDHADYIDIDVGAS